MSLVCCCLAEGRYYSSVGACGVLSRTWGYLGRGWLSSALAWSLLGGAWFEPTVVDQNGSNDQQHGNQAPEVIQLRLAGLGLRAEHLGKTLRQLLAVEQPTDQRADGAEQQLLHQHKHS